MGNSLQKGMRPTLVAPRDMSALTEERRLGHSVTASPPFVIRYARRHLSFLAGL